LYGWCRVLGLDEIMRKESKEAMQVDERGEEFYLVTLIVNY
jgi:hypothetical protein